MLSDFEAVFEILSFFLQFDDVLLKLGFVLVAVGVIVLFFPLVEELLRRRWAILASKQDVFVTSDVPAFIHHPEKPRAGIRTPGFAAVH